MKPRLVALDLDGTLLNSSGRVSERTAASLKRAHESGIVLVPATARWYQAAIRPFTAVGIDPPAIASAGADVRAAGGSVVVQSMLDADLTDFLVSLCERAGWAATLATPECAYRRANELPPWAANAPEWLKPVTTFEGIEFPAVLSLLAEALEGDAYLPELEAWSDRLSIYSALSFNGDALLTVTAPAADKGSGLLALCHHLGIDPSETAAVGDSEVDVPMFRVAGMAVAMADATPEALAAATHHTGAADEDGVAAFLEGLL